MRRRLDRATLKGLIHHVDLTQISVDELLRDYRSESMLRGHLPNGQVAVDPRNGDRVLFNPARARRPHDHEPVELEQTADPADCPICAGKTTGVIDAAPLSEGSTFINKNLYPILYPFEEQEMPARGLHYLQWTSSHHDIDWHNLPAADRLVVLQRLAALERKFIEGGSSLAAPTGEGPYVSIIKNSGASVGASLSHGHQQIGVSNVLPSRMANNLRFQQEHGLPFSSHLLAGLGPALTVRDYGPALLAVPPFMKRPYDMVLLVKDSEKSYLHDLDEGEIEAVAAGWHDATRAYHSILPRLGKEVAYNIAVSNGPGAGLYCEFHPHSQITGGFELFGLYVCQGTPPEAAEDLRLTLG